MPLFTFLKLPEDLKEEIRLIALKEFSGNFYEGASLTRVIKELGISKGSFYRYFRNKLDLYAYLVDHATNLRTEVIEKQIGAQADFFEMIVTNLCLRLQFDLDYPLYGRFLNNIMHERHSEELGNMMLKFKQRMTRLMQEMIDTYQLSSQLPAHVDPQILAFSLVQLQFGLSDYLSLQYGIDLHQTHKPGQSLADVPSDEIEGTIRKFVDLFRWGIFQNSNQTIPSPTNP